MVHRFSNVRRSLLRLGLGTTLLLTAPIQVAAQHAAVREGAEEAAVRAAIDELWAALGAQDEARFTRAVAPDWALVTARGVRVTSAQLLATHRERIKGFALAASNIRVRVQGDLAWAVYDAEMSAQAQGKPWGGRFVVTSVFERRGGAWVCTHTHETRLATE